MFSLTFGIMHYMALLESALVPLGSAAHDFSLRGFEADGEGQTYTLENFADAKVLVLVFMCNHCPYVQAIWDKLVMLQEKYEDEGVQFVGINPNTANPDYHDETFEDMQEYADEYMMNFPYLDDAEQKVAREYDAQCTPDIYVYDQDRKLAYHGRVDDSGMSGEAAKSFELDDALGALVKAEKPADEQHVCMGCSIKWVD
jgi:thiol-disulfide isomerase/thioredoxin